MYTQKIATYRESGKADAYKRKATTIEKAKSIPETEAKKKIPSTVKIVSKCKQNKSNRVTAAQFASIEAIAHTPRSPRFNFSIPQTAKKSTASAKQSSESGNRRENPSTSRQP